MTPSPYTRVHVIINPASGHERPIIQALHEVFHPAGVKWEVSITQEPGDAERLVREAAASGVDLAAVYGGDGTLMHAVNGLVGSGIPLAILPGGTGNAMARQLGIPVSLKEAAGLIVSSPERRAIDLARTGSKFFMLRAYTHISPEDQPSRDQKKQIGQLAYVQAVLDFVRNAAPVQYRARVDNVVIQGQALICLVLNAGEIGGILGINLPPVGDVSVQDGKIDLFVVTEGAQPLRAISHYIFALGESEAGIYHWPGKEIEVDIDPPQNVWLDGELEGKTPLSASVVPQALEIVVPT